MKKPFAIGAAGVLLGAAGAAAAYFLNPGSGKKRRKQAVRESQKIVRRSAHIAAMMGSVSKRETRANQDAAIVARVETELSDSLKESVFFVTVEDGVLTVRGEVEEMAQISAVTSILETFAAGRETLNLIRLRKSA